MCKKLNLMILISLFILVVSPSSVAALETNIKDCLEENDDCLEQLETDQQNIQSNNDGVEDASASNTGSIVINILKIIFALALVLLLIYLLLTFLKRKNNKSVHSSALENLGGLSVGQQKSIQIIRIGEKVYAVGIGNDVNLLDEITDKDVIKQLEEKATTNTEPFSIIQNMLTKKQKYQDQQSEKVSTIPFTDTLETELNKLKKQREQLIEKHKKDDDIHG